MLDRLPPEAATKPRLEILSRRAWVRRAVGDLPGALQDLSTLAERAAEAGEPHLEVQGLMDLARFSLHADRRLCLRASDQAILRSAALEDGPFKTVVRASSGSINLYLKGWNDADAALCRQALLLPGDVRDPALLMRRFVMESMLTLVTGEYQKSQPAAARCKGFARVIGDSQLFVLFNALEGLGLLHLGRWGELRANTAEALAMTERNENIVGSSVGKLSLAWLHAEAQDFAGAKRLCESALDPTFEENPFLFFLRRAVLAKTFLGLNDPGPAGPLLEAIFSRTEPGEINMDCSLYADVSRTYARYWLTAGDHRQAGIWAKRLLDFAMPANNRTYIALAHRMLALIAMDLGDTPGATHHLAHATAALDDIALRLAGWRVYLTAARFHAGLGDAAAAALYDAKYRETVRAVAESFEPDDPLRQSWLDGQAALAGP